MRKTRGVVLGLVLISAVARADARLQAEGGVGASVSLRGRGTGGVVEGAAGVSWTMDLMLVALRLEGMIMAGSEAGMGLGPGLTVQHRIGEGVGWKPWLGGGASYLFAPPFGSAFLSGARLALAGGMVHRDSEGHGVSLGLTVHVYVPSGWVSGCVTVGTGW